MGKRKTEQGMHVKSSKRKISAEGAGSKMKHASRPDSGEVDDFEHMWDEELPGSAVDTDDDLLAEDDKGLGAGAASSGSDSDEGPAGGSSGEDGQQQRPQRAEGGDKAALRAERNREARKRRRGAKLSALEYEASRQLLATLAERPAAEQADYLWMQCQAATQAAPLERQGLGLECEGLAGPLPEGPSLEARLRALAGAAWQPAFCSCPHGTPPGTPAVLCISASALGALAFVKGLPEANKACRIGKLFAKHIKLKEHEEVLGKQAMAIAVGTPNRLLRLSDSGALKLDRLRFVILDTTLDAKQRSVMDLPETRGDLWLLYSRHLAPRIASGAARLVLACGGGAAAAGAAAATGSSSGRGKGPGRRSNSMGGKPGSSTKR